jgi:hypothetical protein
VEEKKKKRKKNNLTGRLTLKFQNNMEIDKILGGVSPLKKRQSSRGGEKAGIATSTASRRGGYAKSSGARGAGGRNVGGYNRQTRFQADKWTPPPSGGDIGPVASPSAPAATAPYSGGTTNYTFGGDTDNSTTTTNTQKSEVDINSGGADTQEWVPEVTGTDGHYETKTTEPGERLGWEDAWNNMEDDGNGGKKNKYGKTFATLEEFEKEGKQWNKDNPGYKSEGGTTRVWVPGTAGKAGYYKTVKSKGGDISVNVNQKIGPPFTMRAHPFYRNYGIGGEPKKK